MPWLSKGMRNTALEVFDWLTGTRGAKRACDHLACPDMRTSGLSRWGLHRIPLLLLCISLNFVFVFRHRAGFHAERVEVDPSCVVVPGVSHGEVSEGRLFLDGRSLPRISPAYRRVAGVVCVERRRGVLTTDPAEMFSAAFFHTGHRPLQLAAALQKQVFPAQDVHPRVQNGVEGGEANGQQVAVVVGLPSGGNISRVVKLIHKNSYLRHKEKDILNRVHTYKNIQVPSYFENGVLCKFKGGDVHSVRTDEPAKDGHVVEEWRGNDRLRTDGIGFSPGDVILTKIVK